jgi:two-component system osmolarity sensor histidine kinase EnvZ
MFRRLRDWAPKGLYWRTLLIILAPAAILQIIITMVFLDDHWESTSKRMSQGVAADVALLIQLYEQDPTPARFAEIAQFAKQPLRLDIALQPGAPLEIARCYPARATVDRYLTRALEEELNRKVWYDASCEGPRVEIRVPMKEGVLRVYAFRDRVQARSGPLFVAWIIVATLVLSIISVLFIRNQVRPIETLAAAMDQFGRGIDPGVFKARGAREVRQATHAFFDMRSRIRRHIDQRAQLLAGVSHDLRTPLTRLKLQFALMPPSPELEDAKRDLTDMELALEEYLAFARGQFAEEPAEADLAALAQEAVASAARAGVDVALEGEALPLFLEFRAGAVKRALHNLIDNAAAHADKVRVSLVSTAAHATVIVEDDGPGIEPDQYEEAFRPFSRLDETRTKNAKGVGLGLAIARDVARSHGGDVILSRSALGGLKAELRLAKVG